MKKTIKAFLKSNRIAYLVYYYLGSAFIKLICLFVKTNNKQILFLSYGGKKYDDSPKYLYEELKTKKEFEDYTMIWAFEEPHKFDFIKNKVKVDSLKYFITASKSRFWITNSSITRGLKFQKKSNINLIFSHGITALKKCGVDIQQKEKTYRLNFIENFSNIFVEGINEEKIVARSWQQDINKIINLGLPRNDNLVKTNPKEINLIKEKLNLNNKKKIILYAPTFRELTRDNYYKNYLELPLNLKEWKKQLFDKYQMIITSHYEVTKFNKTIINDDFIIDCSEYSNINELLKISDILITDYSNILFDYSVFERPIFCYGYDYKEFEKSRGFYQNLNELFLDGVIQTESKLISAIKNINIRQHSQHTRKNIKEKFLKYYDGKSTQRVVDFIIKNYI